MRAKAKAALSGETNRSSLPRSSYKENVQPSYASIWQPPQNPDLRKIRKEATEDARQGNYELALAKRLWYHDNALQVGTGQTGVRLSFALNEWLELGEDYPPALEEMKRRRDELETRMRDPNRVRVRFADFQEFESFNDVLREDERTVELFKWLHETSPDDARRAFRSAKKALINQKELKLINQYLDPQKEFRRIVSTRATDLKLPSMQHEDILHIRDIHDEFFVKKVVTLVALLVVNQRIEEAEELAQQCRDLIEDQKLREQLDRQLKPAFQGKIPRQ